MFVDVHNAAEKAKKLRREAKKMAVEQPQQG